MNPQRQHSTTLRRIGFGACILLACLPLLAQTQDPDALEGPVPPEFAQAPALRLQRVLTGAEALRDLHPQIPALAAWHRMTRERFAAVLRDDRNLRLDLRGRVFFVEPSTDPVRAAVLAATTPKAATAAVPPYPLDQTFLLHSRPGAQRVVYLDFDGEVVTNTGWAPNATLNAQAFDLDGAAGSFSASERERIQFIWQRVAEDYAPFDVDVTTEQPLASDLERSSLSDQRYGTRAVITRSLTELCGRDCGGVAYLGTFDASSNWRYFQPAWVFFDNLANGDEKSIAEAVSHEVGHNLGLLHDALQGDDYYDGHGSGPTGWAPIMGVGFYRSLVQWSRGQYPGADNLEDDLAIMPTNGAPLREDDFGSSLATASALDAQLQNGLMTVDRSGVIERDSDSDYFQFTSGAGEVQLGISAGAMVRSSNLDIAATLYDANGMVIASANDPDGLSAALTVNVASGSYTLRVEGIGDQNPAPGYSDYGSLGQYRISGNFPVSAQAQPLPEVSLDVSYFNLIEHSPPVSISVSLSQASTMPVTVPFTLSGSAASGEDFETPDGTIVTIPPGLTSGSFPLRVIDDSADEAVESVSFQMGTPINATAGASTAATVQIRDNDLPPTVSLSRRGQVLNEGGSRGVLDLQLSAASGRPVVVYLTLSGTAQAGTDYASITTAVSIRPGVSLRRLFITPLENSVGGANKSLTVTISSVTNGAIGSLSQYRATIVNND